MINEIEKQLKQSGFKTWVALSNSLGYHSRGALKQKTNRLIKAFNNILRPLGLELTIKKLK